MAVGAHEEHTAPLERNSVFLEATSKQLFLLGAVLPRTGEAAQEGQRLLQIGALLSGENAPTHPSLTSGNPHRFSSLRRCWRLPEKDKKKNKNEKSSSEDPRLDCDR